MQIKLESLELHSIQSYNEKQIRVNGVDYASSVIISKDKINPQWKINSVLELDPNNLAPLLESNPEVIIIGQQKLSEQIPKSVISFLSSLRIGIECMSIGAACRTFNVLLNENRLVVVGIILES